MVSNLSSVSSIAQALKVQTSFDVIGSLEWSALKPTDITDIIPTVDKQAHETIDPTNVHEKGATVKVSAAPKIRTGFNVAMMDALLEGAIRATYSGPQAYRLAAERPTSATAAHFVVPAQTALPEGTLIWVAGCLIAANNGLKRVAASSTTTNIIVTGGLTAETFTAAQNVTIEVCGFEFTAADATLTVSGSTITLGATAKNLTQLALVSGQSIFVGDPSDAAYMFSTGTASNYGPARVAVAPTAGAIVLEMPWLAFSTNAGTGKTIRIRFGQTTRNEPLTGARYVERLYCLESVLAKVHTADAPAYVYDDNSAIGTFTVAAPSNALITLAADLMATNGPIETTRRTGASSPTAAKQTTAYSTATRDGISGRVWIKSGLTQLTGAIMSSTVVIENQLGENPGQGAASSVAVTWGKMKVTAAITAYLVHTGQISAALDNDTITANWMIRNSEAAYLFDIPEGTIGTGQLGTPKNGAISIDMPVTAHGDGTWATQLIVSKIPGCPALPARA